MAKKGDKQVVIVDPTTLEANTPEELLARGWLFLTRKEYAKSETDLRSALEQQPGNYEILYALALLLAADNRPQEAVQAFEQALKALDSLENIVRAHMLRRLLNGHINRIKTGDWHLSH
jgi:tetratricopeptide (TPR) repeat protein